MNSVLMPMTPMTIPTPMICIRVAAEKALVGMTAGVVEEGVAVVEGEVVGMTAV